MAFFETLNFSSANEDGDSELAALAGATRILCLTGSGTRPLDLLAGTARQVVALDANPVQNALLALKVAAMARMERAQYLAFVGISPDENRPKAYAALRAELDPQARSYWDAHPRAIARGIWHAGQWERLLGWNARFLRLFRGRAVKALMAAPDLAAQQQVWREYFTAKGWLGGLEALGRDLVWRLVMREPAAAYLPPASEVAAYLQERFAAASACFMLRESDCATLALQGRHSADGALPVHLRDENYDRVRADLPRLRIISADLADLTKHEPRGFDGFSLSDFGSYCGMADYAACWHAVLAAAIPGARYCERIFLNDMSPPSPRIGVNEPLSARLSASDKAVIYRIRAGTIGPAR